MKEQKNCDVAITYIGCTRNNFSQTIMNFNTKICSQSDGKVLVETTHNKMKSKTSITLSSNSSSDLQFSGDSSDDENFYRTSVPQGKMNCDFVSKQDINQKTELANKANTKLFPFPTNNISSIVQVSVTCHSGPTKENQVSNETVTPIKKKARYDNVFSRKESDECLESLVFDNGSYNSNIKKEGSSSVPKKISKTLSKSSEACSAKQSNLKKWCLNGEDSSINASVPCQAASTIKSHVDNHNNSCVQSSDFDESSNNSTNTNTEKGFSSLPNKNSMTSEERSTIYKQHDSSNASMKKSNLKEWSLNDACGFSNASNETESLSNKTYTEVNYMKHHLNSSVKKRKHPFKEP